MSAKKQIPLRLSPKLWEELSRWADDEFRSVNGQIEYILHRAVQDRIGKNTDPETRENINKKCKDNSKRPAKTTVKNN